jgi:hypothetical protein
VVKALACKAAGMPFLDCWKVNDKACCSVEYTRRLP